MEKYETDNLITRAENSNLLNFGIDLPQFGIDSY